MKSPIMDEIPPLTGTVRTNWRPFEGASVPARRRWHLFRPVPFFSPISNRSAVMSFLVENATVDSAYAAIATTAAADDDDDGVDEDVDNTRQSV